MFLPRVSICTDSSPLFSTASRCHLPGDASSGCCSLSRSHGTRPSRYSHTDRLWELSMTPSPQAELATLCLLTEYQTCLAVGFWALLSPSPPSSMKPAGQAPGPLPFHMLGPSDPGQTSGPGMVWGSGWIWNLVLPLECHQGGAGGASERLDEQGSKVTLHVCLPFRMQRKKHEVAQLLC